MGLRLRLILIIALTSLPVAGVGTYLAVNAGHRAVRDAQEDARAVAELVADEHRELIERSRHLLTGLTFVRVVRERRVAECAGFFADLVLQYETYTTFGITDAEGTIICSAPSVAAGESLRGRLLFKRLEAMRAFTVGEYSSGRSSGKPSLGLAAPLFGKDGDFSGMLFAALDTDWLMRRLGATRIPSGATVTVLDRDGVVLTRFPSPDDWVGKTVREFPALAPVLAGDSDARDAVDLDGRRRLFGFVRMVRGNTVVAVGIDHQTASAAMYRSLGQIIVTSLVFLGLVLGAAWVGTAALVLRPVRRLLAATRRFTAGDLDSRVGVAPPAAELGELAEAFDRMAEALQRRTREAELAEQRYRGLFERNLAGMFRSAAGRLLECNPAFARMFGYESPADVMAYPLSALYADVADRDQLLSDLAGGAPLAREIRGCRKDGADVWVLLQITEVQVDGATCLEGITIDVTDRRQREAAHREGTALREVAALANAAAHEINNPLAIIQANLDLMAPGTLEPRRQAGIGGAMKRITEIIARMNRITRLERPPNSSGIGSMLDLYRSSDKEAVTAPGGSPRSTPPE